MNSQKKQEFNKVIQAQLDYLITTITLKTDKPFPPLSSIDYKDYATFLTSLIPLIQKTMPQEKWGEAAGILTRTVAESGNRMSLAMRGTYGTNMELIREGLDPNNMYMSIYVQPVHRHPQTPIEELRAAGQIAKDSPTLFNEIYGKDEGAEMAAALQGIDLLGSAKGRKIHKDKPVKKEIIDEIKHVLEAATRTGYSKIELRYFKIGMPLSYKLFQFLLEFDTVPSIPAQYAAKITSSKDFDDMTPQAQAAAKWLALGGLKSHPPGRHRM